MIKNTQIRFVGKEHNTFTATLNKRVHQYFLENKLNRYANGEMVLKTIILLSTYLLPFVAMLIFQPNLLVSLMIWTLMGLSLAGIGMNIMHDANHGSYSKNQRINTLLGHSLNLCGGSVLNWKFQHNVLHHTFTNVVHVDEDIDDKLVFRFSPHTNLKWFHKLQTVYAILFYGIITLYWVTLKDFLQFSRYIKKGVIRDSFKNNLISFIKIIITKAFYWFVFFIMPIYIFNIPFLQVLSGFLLMHFVAGIVLTVIFQLAHTVEGTSYPLPNSEGNIENNWAVHQMNTTVNFSRNNRIISWFVGGLNFQVEHHLFPNICHVHYPKISTIVKQTAEEFGIPYLENKTFWDALVSHLRALNKFGKLPNLNEAIG